MIVAENLFEIIQLFRQIQVRIILRQLFYLGHIALQKLPVVIGVRETWAVGFGSHNILYLLHYRQRIGINTRFYKLLPYKGSSQVIRMHKIHIIEPVITQDINDQLVSLEVMAIG